MELQKNKFVNTLMNEALHCAANNIPVWQTPYMEQFNELLNFLKPDELKSAFADVGMDVPESFSTWNQLIPPQTVPNYKFVPLCFNLANQLANLVYNGAL